MSTLIPIADKSFGHPLSIFENKPTRVAQALYGLPFQLLKRN